MNMNLKVAGCLKDDEEKNILISMGISCLFYVQLLTHIHTALESRMSKYRCFYDHDYIRYDEVSS